MTVSIIIAVKTWQKTLKECVGKCRQLNFKDFEIIALPDIADAEDISGLLLTDNIRIVPTEPISPPRKRDLGIRFARGDFIAFIDDDAYPENNWLAKALENFKDPEIAAVGGPAVTPPEDTPAQKASGAIYASALVSAGYTYRYRPGERRFVEDYPTCNLLVRASILDECGGFKTGFWPGEDTVLCFEITKNLHKKILYDPALVMYHHRRPVFAPHLTQVANYALHRGYFAKRYPATSRKFAYFVPSIFVIGVLNAACASAVSQPARFLSGICAAVYCLAVLAAALYSLGHLGSGRHSLFDKIRFASMVFTGIILTHFTYGIYFIKGLLSLKLKEER